ncbi:conserved membrane hypothetical protein [Leptospira interrogans serovar Manilae]|uniref:Lipoprotein n=1 Tax=Leptospira interrogans serovar Manilae TaxID=214675 RepID=A0AAQ1SQG2_LEPIR|nr:DUF1420 domain-containing protein [Leptospira interrogans]AKP26347.1 hypothetical protein LIMLP_10615 [Leptospira interrogans serovar Manilae]AKP30131.1 hypothetical protein LIMHP_10625 [Leptospira interrogans serovar Manilae]EYU63730.1 hypothetical protein CI00_12200 [Leptospira interrogans serovar Manilae]SOR63264.1 conserved membrane hypothetical protein [Leptospira interrogans serovar Manilae]
MKFGLDANVAYPPLSVLYSIFLIFGCDFLGFYILKLFESSIGKVKNTWIRWQAPLIGALLLSVILYPLALSALTPRFLMKSAAIFLSVLGCANICFFVKNGTKNLVSISYYSNIFKSIQYHSFFEKIGNDKKIKKSFSLFKLIGFIKNKFNLINKNDVLNVFIILLMIGYGFLALCPITNADSLDYHIGVAIEILNQGKMPVFSDWFHGRLAGSGEVLNALGLAIGAEQFGSLLQFCGLLSIYGILSFYSFAEKFSESDGVWRKIIIIAFLSSPVLVFLVSSPKPQLLQIGMTSFAITLLLEIFSKIKTDKNKLFAFSLICILIMSATQAKFSFFLSAFLIGLFSIFSLGSIRLFFYGLLISLFFFVLINFPAIFWKIKNYNSTFIDVLIHPLPGNTFPGVNEFEVSLRNYQDSALIFPLSLIFPNQFGVITTVIGLGLFLIIFVKPIVTQKAFLLSVMIILFVILGSLMGQKASRFFLEPFVWMLISLIGLNSFGKWNIRFVKEAVSTGILLQACATLVIISVGIYQLFPGVFSISLREKVMSQYANGYSLMKWVGLTLPKEAVLLSQHRSIALSERKTLSLDWIPFVDFNSAVASPYLKQIKDENVTHILMFGDTSKNTPFSGCIGNTIGKTKSNQVTRNPFNRNDFFTVILVEFQSDKLPQCANFIL